MTRKILFFSDMWFFNFGASKFLQNKLDAEFYGIFDVDDKTKKFFSSQNLVKYEKIWFFLDCLTDIPKEPDLEFLKTFEKKYGINLWSVLFFDREFHQFNRFYKFSDNELLCILERECKFFEKILEDVNPDYLSIYISISHYQELLRLMCKAKGIKILMLGPSKVGQRMMISDKGLIMDNLNCQKGIDDISISSYEQLQNYVKIFSTYSRTTDYTKKNFENNFWKRYKPILKFFLSKRSKSFSIRYTYFGHTRFAVFKDKLRNFFLKKFRSHFIDKHFSIDLDSDGPFIYYPLHQEPERNLLIDSPFHCNQIEVIKNITKSLPVNHTLFVKEHITQKVFGWRKISFYKELINLPNVKLIHPSVPPTDILKKCSMVITVGGTPGLEALFFNKQVITFTDTFYTSVPAVHIVKNYEDLSKTIQQCLDQEVNLQDMNDFISIIKQNTFLLDVISLPSDFSYRFGFKGPIMDAELKEYEIKKFLDDYNDEFNKLAEEHVKKILEEK